MLILITRVIIRSGICRVGMGKRDVNLHYLV